MATVLIADDHDLVRAALVSYLADATGDNVTEASSLDEALQKICQDGPFDLVLLITPCQG